MRYQLTILYFICTIVQYVRRRFTKPEDALEGIILKVIILLLAHLLRYFMKAINCNKHYPFSLL